MAPAVLLIVAMPHRPSLLFGLVLLPLALRATEAPAEEPPLEDNPAVANHVLIGAGLEGARIYCSSCQSDDNSPGYAGFYLEPLVRLSPVVALGGIAAFAVRPGSKGTEAGETGAVEHESLLRASGELRLGRPGRRADGWFSFELGATGAYHSVDRYGGVTNPGFQSSWQTAPVFGIGGGADVRLSRTVSLGASLRLLAFIFSNPTGFESSNPLDVYRGPQPSVTLSLGATYDLF